VTGVQKAVVEQVVVDVGDEDGEGHAPPQLLDVRLSGGAMDAQGVDDLRVVVLTGIGGLRAENRSGRRVEQPASVVRPVETTDERHGDTLAVNQARLRGVNSGVPCEVHREDLAFGHCAFVGHAGELANGEPTLFVDHCAFRSQPAERGSAPAKVREVGLGFAVGLEGSTGRCQVRELDQGRRRATAGLGIAAEDSFFVLEPKGAHTARVVDLEEKVEMIQRPRLDCGASATSLLNALCVIAQDDASSPAVGFRVRDDGVEDRALSGFLVKLGA
jgi:hypothetical protein